MRDCLSHTPDSAPGHAPCSRLPTSVPTASLCRTRTKHFTPCHCGEPRTSLRATPGKQPEKIEEGHVCLWGFQWIWSYFDAFLNYHNNNGFIWGGWARKPPKHAHGRHKIVNNTCVYVFPLHSYVRTSPRIYFSKIPTAQSAAVIG